MILINTPEQEPKLSEYKMEIILLKEFRKEMIVYYFEREGKLHTIKGIHHKGKNSTERNDFAKILRELRNNNFSYFKEYGSSKITKIEDLYDLLETTDWDNKDRFVYECNEFWDCYGKIKEVGENFFFRIYDKKIIEKIETIINIKEQWKVK